MGSFTTKHTMNSKTERVTILSFAIVVDIVVLRHVRKAQRGVNRQGGFYTRAVDVLTRCLAG
jgi:hypothetical protein